MIRLFLSISKGEELRFLGHLDYLRTMERAIMRSGLPVAFSEGFNPHMKISMDSALGVGVTADPLYMEMDLEREVPLDEVKSSLTSQLPGGISINGIPSFPRFSTKMYIRWKALFMKIMTLPKPKQASRNSMIYLLLFIKE